MPYEYVLYEKKGQVVIITMNRPERRNSWSWEMLRDLRIAFQEFQDDAGARVSILTGKGTAFCAGRDLKEAAEMSSLSDEERTKIEQEMDRWMAFYRYYLAAGALKPIITAVNGYAIGGGFGFTSLGTLRVAAERAMFQIGEINVGRMAGWDLALTGVIPFCIATELALGRRISAQRTYEAGLLNKVVPDAELMPAAMEMAEHILSLPPLSVKYTLDGLRRSKGAAHPALAELQRQRAEQLWASEDVKEAAQAFVEKRKPVFKGR